VNTMHFDPAIAAQQALQRAQEDGELGDLRDEIIETEETFSSSAGAEATQAFEKLQQFGEQLPDAQAFQEFLIYITWQQVTEDTIPRYFQFGATLSDRFLKRFGKGLHGSDTLRQVQDIRSSFRSGFGMQDDSVPGEYEEDAFKGGD
jgi:hypothetical protein